jgi:DNA-binding NtrC family response regulator
LAQPLRSKVYSPAGTMALEQARRTGALGVPLTLLAAPGLDPVPWAAVAHLAGVRATRPLVVVHGTDTEEHDLKRWRDPEASPLSLADGGTLLAVDVQALPRMVQDFIAASLSERVAPSGAASPLDVWLAVSVPATVDALVAAGRLSAVLADWLGDRALALPPVDSRPEDLRAMVLDHLSRVGARLRGEPLGIDDRALAILMEHSWTGNDVELADVMLRAALCATGSRVTLEDLATAGFALSASDGSDDREHDVDAGPRLPSPRGSSRRSGR